MKNMLLKHYEIYPKMQLRDAVKLAFQSEFGGGHMIRSEADSLQRLKDEYNTLQVSSDLNKMFEDIGTGMCRLNLGSLEGISLDTVNRFFVVSANTAKDSVGEFEKKLACIIKCCEERLLPFDTDEAEVYIKELKEKGYPPVSHSEEYRQAYKPAYRVVKAQFKKFFRLFERIEQILATQDVLTVAIDGNSGAGKTWLAALIKSVYDKEKDGTEEGLQYGCNVFPMDHFFLTPERKTEQRLNENGGNIDHERFLSDVIGGIDSMKPFSYRPYDCRVQALAQPIKILPKRLNIVEGCYSMHPNLAENYHLKVFMEIDPETQKNRILKRNGAAMLKRYVREWIPLENNYFSNLDIKNNCDLVFNGDF